jgi:hypothetical protein
MVLRDGDCVLASVLVCRRVIIFIKDSSSQGSYKSNKCYLGIQIVLHSFDGLNKLQYNNWINKDR